MIVNRYRRQPVVRGVPRAVSICRGCFEDEAFTGVHWWFIVDFWVALPKRCEWIPRHRYWEYSDLSAINFARESVLLFSFRFCLIYSLATRIFCQQRP